VTNCTFSGNQATAADGGGGMYNDNSSPTVKNTILAGNTPDDCDGLPDSRGSCTDISGNPVSYDQRGVARPFGSNCDIGAYEATFGDLNSDGAIDLLDARLCAQIAQGYITGTAQQRAAADVDSDGDVDADDVTILSEYILGMRTTLP